MAEERHGSHHYKLILALLLVLGIIGLAAYSNVEGFSGFKLGQFAATKQTEPFGVSLSTSATALYGKSFSLSGVPAQASGICSSIQINNLKVEREETRCSVSSEGFTGTFQYSQYGSIVLTGSSDSLTLNSDKFSSDRKVSFTIEVIPSEFSIFGIAANQLSLVAPSGKIEKYGNDSSLKGIQYLSQSPLDISNLNGRAELSNGELKVIGTATSVKGQDFSW